MHRLKIALSNDRWLELRWLVPLAIMILLLHVASVSMLWANGIPDLGMMGDYARKALLVSPIVVLSGIAIIILRCALAGEREPLRKIGTLVRSQFPDNASIASRAVLLMLMPVLFCAHGTLKMLMPVAVGFQADNFISRMDQLLFAGAMPWQLTHAILGDTATLVIDRFYTFWVPLLGLAIAYFALFARAEDRARFFLTFSGAWILLGVIGAYIGSSVGPCFMELTGHAAPGHSYADLMAHLREIDAQLGGTPDKPAIDALRWQGVLWNAYQSQNFSFGMGISAMPSMHVSIATIYALCARRLGSGPFIAALAFLLLTLVGSVHLGWHYASDALVSIPATIAIWMTVDRYLRAVGVVRTGEPEAIGQELVPAT